jgi:hypothetical protein
LASSDLVAGSFGIVITITEGVLHLNQFEQIGLRPLQRVSRETEKHTYLIGSICRSADRHALLAERIESLVPQEHEKWAPVQQKQSNRELQLKMKFVSADEYSAQLLYLQGAQSSNAQLRRPNESCSSGWGSFWGSYVGFLLASSG